MGSVCTCFTPEMFIPVNGLMVAAMDVVSIAVKMVVGMQAHSNGVLNMVLVTTISGMGIHMLENILQTKCTDLEFIILQTDIDTMDHGMKEEGKDLECTLSETVKRNLDTGRMAFLMFQAQRI